MKGNDKSGIALCIKERGNKNHKAVNILLISIAVGVFILCVLNRSSFINGAEVTLNRLFTLSEAKQNYAYKHFDASGSNVFFLLAVTAEAVCLLVMGVVNKARFVPAIMLAVLVGAELYFGVMPPLYISLPLVLFLAFLMLGRVSFSGLAMLTILAVATAGASFALAPSEMPKVNQINESIRDLLDEGEQMLSGNYELTPSPTESEPDYKGAQTNKDKSPTNGESVDNGRGGSKKHASNISIISVNMLKIIVLLAVALALLSWCIALVASAIKRRRSLKKNGRELVEKCFLSSLRLLGSAGLKLRRSNAVSDYAEAVGELFSVEYKEKYIEACELWWLALYSRERLLPAQEEKIREFYLLTRRLVLKKEKPLSRFKIIFVKLY